MILRPASSREVTESANTYVSASSTACPYPSNMSDLSSYDIWDVVAQLRNPMGPAVALSPGEPTPSISMTEVDRRSEEASSELSARDFTDDQIAAIREGDDRIVMAYLAAGGARYRSRESD